MPTPIHTCLAQALPKPASFYSSESDKTKEHSDDDDFVEPELMAVRRVKPARKVVGTSWLCWFCDAYVV